MEILDNIFDKFFDTIGVVLVIVASIAAVVTMVAMAMGATMISHIAFDVVIIALGAILIPFVIWLIISAHLSMMGYV